MQVKKRYLNGCFPVWNMQRFMLHLQMIAGFRHKGLKLYYEKGDASKLQPKHVAKIRLILTRLEAASAPEMMQVPGYQLHPLSGDLKGFWSVKVDKNFRIIFRFEGENVYDVDYIDYH